MPLAWAAEFSAAQRAEIVAIIREALKSDASILRDAVAALDEHGPGPAWPLTDLVLFESDTRATGAVHTEVARIPLALG